MIKFAAWNIRGLNDPLKQKEVISFVKKQSLTKKFNGGRGLPVSLPIWEFVVK